MAALAHGYRYKFSVMESRGRTGVMRLIGRLSVVAIIFAAGCSEGFNVSQVDESVIRVVHIARGKLKDGTVVNLSAGHGTGFLIARGYVATNHHVVQRPELPSFLDYLGLYVPDGSWKEADWRRAEVIWAEPDLDLAVIRVPDLDRAPLVLSAIDPNTSPDKGHEVYALGFPGLSDPLSSELPILEEGALDPKLNPGAVSRVMDKEADARRLGFGRPVILHTAEISQGNSGGPLLNACNEVVGINTVIKANPEVGVTDFYSPHVSALVAAIDTESVLSGISASQSFGICIPGEGESLPLYVVTAVALALAVASLVVAALRRPKAVVQVMRRTGEAVSTASQLIRSGRAHSQASALRRAARSSGAAARADDHTTQWNFTGYDGDGRQIAFDISDADLRSAGSDGVVIGRQQSLARVVLTDPSISRRHAQILATRDGIGVVDLNSRNGTELEGQIIPPYDQPRLVVAGATLRLGQVRLRVARS